MLTFGSLFAGIGGFDLGFAGMECAAQVEIDATCRSVLARHWPAARRFEDVREVHGHDLGPVDLVCGGFPCQDLSVAGKRKGLAGERSGLWFEFHRLLAEARPQWVVIENVPGLLSSNGGRDFAVVLRGLVELGYGVCWRVLDAQYFGVPQRRRRVFIVGHLGDGRAAQVLFEPESVSGDSAPRREAGTRIARSLAVGSVSSGYRYDPNGEEHVVSPFTLAGFGEYQPGFGTLRANGGDVGPGSESIIANTLRAEGFDASEDGTGRGTPLVPMAFEPRYARNGRGAPDRVVPPLKAQSGQTGKGDGAACVAAMYGVRRLTPTECERLQGFPDDWTRWGHDGKELSDSVRYRMLGNAVCVNVAEWIGRRIINA